MSDIPENDRQLAWEWFKYHAEQRLRAFYYYLIIIGAFGFAFLNCYDNCPKQDLIPSLSFLGMIVTFVFLILEVRNVELVNIGRSVLRKYGFEPAWIDYYNEIKNGDKNILREHDLNIDILKKENEKCMKEALRGSLIPRYLIKFQFSLRLFYYIMFSVCAILLMQYFFPLRIDLILGIIIILFLIFVAYLIFSLRGPSQKRD